MWSATIDPTVPIEDDGGPFYFASLDGEHFIGVDRKPRAGDEDVVAKMFEGNGRIKPMLLSTGYLRQTAKEFWCTDVVFEEV